MSGGYLQVLDHAPTTWGHCTWKLAIVMADIANPAHGYMVWAGLENMAARARISESSARRALAELIDTGWVVDTGQRTKWGTRVYTWNPHAGAGTEPAEVPPWPPVPEAPHFATGGIVGATQAPRVAESGGVSVTPPHPARGASVTPGGVSVTPGGVSVTPGGVTVTPELEVEPVGEQPQRARTRERAPAGNPAGPPAPTGRPNRDTVDREAPPAGYRSELGREALAEARARALGALGAAGRRERDAIEAQRDAHQGWCADRLNPALFEQPPPSRPSPMARAKPPRLASLFAGASS